MTQAPSLFNLIARRILAVTFAAMIIQFALVFNDFWDKTEELSRKLVEMETEQLLQDLKVSGNSIKFEPSPQTLKQFPVRPAATPARMKPDALTGEVAVPGYFARVRTMGGPVLFTNCKTECDEQFVPLSLTPPDFWIKMIEFGRPLTFAGGQSFAVADQTVAIEFASIGDPAGRIWYVLLREVFDQMLVPMILMLVMIMGVTVISIRFALKPVHLAAAAAEELDPKRSLQELPTEGMPREIKKLTQAINRALARVKESMASRTLFASAIAHEIRTPVSIVQLELEQINHPRAEKALADLFKLTQTLDTLTSLARLDAVIDPELKDCDLADIAREVTASMAPIVFASAKTIAFEDLGKTAVFTAPLLVENLIRNLIENAVKHATSGSTIKVVAGPGPVLEISDEIQAAASRKPGQESKVDMKQNTTKATTGIGQRIVERICELLGADFLVSRNRLGGHTATIRFESNRG